MGVFVDVQCLLSDFVILGTADQISKFGSSARATLSFTTPGKHLTRYLFFCRQSLL